MIILIIRSTKVICFAIIPLILSSLFANAELTEEYREAAVNGSQEINHKEWTWKRNEIIVFQRIISDISNRGEWSKHEEVVFYRTQKVFYSLRLDDEPSEIFYPAAGLRVLRSDSNKDGIMDRIVLMDVEDQLVDLFELDNEGKLRPATEKKLNDQRDLLKRFSESMKDF